MGNTTKRSLHKKANDDAKRVKEYAEKNGIRTMGISSNRIKILIEK